MTILSWDSKTNLTEQILANSFQQQNTKKGSSSTESGDGEAVTQFDLYSNLMTKSLDYECGDALLCVGRLAK